MARTPARNSEKRLETALQQALATLPDAAPRERAFLLKRAGDVCVGLDEPRKALGWYGRAVDQFLELGDAEQAALLCRLIIFVQPEAVRARCTLTWIAIGREDHADALEQLTAYVDAARRAAQVPLTVEQLTWMFGASSSPELRHRIVAGLRYLGEPARAEALAPQLAETPAPLPREQLWARVLDATIGQSALSVRATS